MGLGPVVTSHMVRAVPLADELDDALPLPAADPHPASAVATVAAATSVSHLRRLARSPDMRMFDMTFLLGAAGGISERFRKLSSVLVS